MKLSEYQAIFTYNLADLILYANSIGIALTQGDAYRPHELQLLYYYGNTVEVDKSNNTLKLTKAPKRSKTLNSNHNKRLAQDFNHFIDGKLTYDKHKLKQLGDYWCGLHPKNRWGGNWGWDIPHYEMNV